MAKAIEQILNSGGKTLTIGHFGLGMHGQDVGSAKQQVHDGDTITVRALGNLGVRFLGVDAPEISFRLPGIGQQQFIPVSDPRWEAFLRDPFAGSEGAAWAEAHEHPARTVTRKTGTISDWKQNLCCLKSSSRTEISAEPVDEFGNHAGRAELACASVADEDSLAAGPPSRELSVAG